MPDDFARAHPPRPCGDGTHCNNAVLEPRLSELAIHQSDGWRAGAVWQCKRCDWKRVEPLRDLPPVGGD